MIRNCDGLINENDFIAAGVHAPSAYASQNWIAATDKIQRAAIVAPHIPAVLKETNAALAAAEKEVKDLAAEHSLDLPRLIATLRQPRTPAAQVVYSLAK